MKRVLFSGRIKDEGNARKEQLLLYDSYDVDYLEVDNISLSEFRWYRHLLNGDLKTILDRDSLQFLIAGSLLLRAHSFSSRLNSVTDYDLSYSYTYSSLYPEDKKFLTEYSIRTTERLSHLAEGFTPPTTRGVSEFNYNTFYCSINMTSKQDCNATINNKTITVPKLIARFIEMDLPNDPLYTQVYRVDLVVDILIHMSFGASIPSSVVPNTSSIIYHNSSIGYADDCYINSHFTIDKNYVTKLLLEHGPNDYKHGNPYLLKDREGLIDRDDIYPYIAYLYSLHLKEVSGLSDFYFIIAGLNHSNLIESVYNYWRYNFSRFKEIIMS